MIILISPEKDVKDELTILHQLFEKGLQYYHLRKPSKSEAEYRSYLDGIGVAFYDRIVTHQYHHLAEQYNLKGVHLKEQFRLDLGDELSGYIQQFKVKSQTVSSSFHHPNDVENCKADFNYHLLSPVFNSISKQGYEGKGFSVNEIDRIIIGMGGVTVNNLSEIKVKGYKGAGVLGGVWNAENPVLAFDGILNASSFGHPEFISGSHNDSQN